METFNQSSIPLILSINRKIKKVFLTDEKMTRFY